MDRRELIRNLTLNQITDLYENIDQCILCDVKELAAKLGFAVGRSEVVEALRGLIRDGLAKASRFSSFPPHEIKLDGMPDVDAVEVNFSTYFHVTPKGREFRQSEDFPWPFDDDGNPLIPSP